jgi:transglutaminase-like putative cysteine protease
MTDDLVKDTIAPPPRRRLSVRHETVYRYQGAASLGYSLAWLTPRPLPTQDLREHRLNVFPKPRFLHESFDAFGNVQHYFEVHKGHSELRIQSQAVVECAAAPDLTLLAAPWESYCVESCSGADGDDSSLALDDPAIGDTATGDPAAGDPPPWDFVYPTQLIPLADSYTDYARTAFTPGRPFGEALLALNTQIYRDFQYVPGATDVDTPLAEVWEQRAGVCQDFAHFAVACLRGLGLPAAYISGYLLTYPNPGESKRIGADASHAWFAVWAGAKHGWVQLDPTNDLVVGDEHIVVAIGRDYSDTPPVKGVCFGGGQHQLSVAVTVEQLGV